MISQHTLFKSLNTVSLLSNLRTTQRVLIKSAFPKPENSIFLHICSMWFLGSHGDREQLTIIAYDSKKSLEKRNCHKFLSHKLSVWCGCFLFVLIENWKDKILVFCENHRFLSHSSFSSCPSSHFPINVMFFSCNKNILMPTNLD